MKAWRTRLALALGLAAVAVGVWALWPAPERQPPMLEWEQPAASLADVQKLRYELRFQGSVRNIQPTCSQSALGFTCRMPLDPVPAGPFEVCAIDQAGGVVCSTIDPR